MLFGREFGTISDFSYDLICKTDPNDQSNFLNHDASLTDRNGYFKAFGPINWYDPPIFFLVTGCSCWGYIWYDFGCSICCRVVFVEVVLYNNGGYWYCNKAWNPQ